MTHSSTSGGNYPAAGVLPAPANSLYSAAQCDTQKALLSTRGELVVKGLKPGTKWTVEFDDKTAQMVGSLQSGATDVKHEGVDIEANQVSGVQYAQLTLTGPTNGTCVVINPDHT